MAAKAAAKKRKPVKKTSVQNRKRKAQTESWHSALLRLCFFICLIPLSIAALFRLGVIGSFLFEAVALFFGWLAVPFYITAIALSILLIVYRKQRMPLRYTASLLCIITAASLFLGTQQYHSMPSSDVLPSAFAGAMQVFDGEISVSGLYGALLFALFSALFEVPGCYLFCIFFLVLGLVLCSYTWFLENRDKMKKPQLPVKRKEVPAAEKKLVSEKIPVLPAEEKGSSFRIIEADEVTEISNGKEIPEKNRKRRRKEQKSSIDIAADDLLNASHFIQEPFEQMKPAIPAAPASEETETPPVPQKAGKKQKEEIPVPEKPAEYIAFSNPFENYRRPPLSILDDAGKKVRSSTNKDAASVQGQKLIDILRQFSVDADLKEVHIGPSVTKFEITLKPGVRVNKITSLSGDIKMALAATDIRIEAPIPGKSAVGIEIPNVEKTTVHMKEVLRKVPASLKREPLLIGLGKDLLGECVYGRLDKMPHLLIAGATGSGKSVCVNSIICSMLLRARPDEVKLILIDPKKVEFTPYNGIPHLLAPVITDGNLANDALKVIVNMMDARYDLFGNCGVRNIESYNTYVQEHPESHMQPLPRIVVIIDELADLMLVAAKEVEQSIQRITQLARAAGIHLIVATQRPSVDIITGVIKANIPSRIAFAVSQGVDSRTILDQSGAEKLLGYGDMLYLPNGETAPRRVQGVFIEDGEVQRIAEYVCSQAEPHYDDTFIQLQQIANTSKDVSPASADPLYEQVKRFVIANNKASTSLIQRQFSVGYGRAARLIDILEAEGIVGPANGSKPRKILVQNTSEGQDEIL